MDFEGRIISLEKIAQSRKGTGEDIRLFDSGGEQVPGKIVRMPTAKQTGLAQMIDGTRPILYERYWSSGMMCPWKTLGATLRIRCDISFRVVGCDMSRILDLRGE